MKKFLSGCFLLILLACSGSKETPAEVYDLSFTCPAGWTVSEQEDYGDSKYMSIEKEGFSSSGIVMITYANEEFELTDYLDIHKESYKEQKIFSNIKFNLVKDSSYGQYDGILAEYRVSVMSVAHVGRMYVFHAKGKTICVTEQEAVEDSAKNKTGFEKIRETFLVR